jgi:GMP synthase-like glutamine amidotransferase
MARRLFVIVNMYNKEGSINLKRLIAFFQGAKVDFKLVATRAELADLYERNVDVAGMVFTGSQADPKLTKTDEVEQERRQMFVAAYILFKDVPKLCICFSHQLYSVLAGGTVMRMIERKVGEFKVALDNGHPLFKGLDKQVVVTTNHRYCVTKPAPGVRVIASGTGDPNAPDYCRVQAFVNDETRVYAMQFHPEGRKETQVILKNFMALCGKNAS